MRSGSLLVNLGSPDSPSVSDVRRYLAQFLMDPYVIDVPYLLRLLIVYGTILPFRPQESAKAYQTIWTQNGSPLVHTTQQVKSLLSELIDAPIEVGMRYGNPSIESAVKRLLKSGCTQIKTVLLYPHYAMSSYETGVVEVSRVLKKYPQVQLTVVPPFFDHPLYIQALTDSIKPYLHQPYDHVLFSYHGLPERHLKKSDPTGCHCLMAENCCETPSKALATCYRAQVKITSKLTAEALQIPSDKWSISFQSRLGKDPWLKPFTDEEWIRLPQSGKKRLVVLSPAFVSDCLETLEELGDRGKEAFLENGGDSFTLVPCLNTHPKWIEALADLVR